MAEELAAHESYGFVVLLVFKALLSTHQTILY